MFASMLLKKIVAAVIVVIVTHEVKKWVESNR